MGTLDLRARQGKKDFPVTLVAMETLVVLDPRVHLGALGTMVARVRLVNQEDQGTVARLAAREPRDLRDRLEPGDLRVQMVGREVTDKEVTMEVLDPKVLRDEWEAEENPAGTDPGQPRDLLGKMPSTAPVLDGHNRQIIRAESFITHIL